MRRNAFHAIGLKWEGTFAEAGAGGIRAVLKEMQERLHEIKQVIHPETLLGLSYNLQPSSFTHYAAVQVAVVEDIPQGMMSIFVPALTYAKCQHTKGGNIDDSYQNLFAWIAA
ncbi:GyrI-like domain-containing protein [Alicyclobacillus dauci]|uniref:GyrI-like domain-containing protein n=1 Tax=Alicyclobacillus dauci TaxID=1475485 RepID=A0ABY6YZG9_9BACL|nr:GyrI-like domain-containing protein [Alicyclobacillus dauci]WAH36019.1 GyrI-like domain-containing protein [Alicyclobacillus dauci]